MKSIEPRQSVMIKEEQLDPIESEASSVNSSLSLPIESLPQGNHINMLLEKIDTLIKTKKYKKAAKEIQLFEKDFSLKDQLSFLLFDIRMKSIYKQIKHLLEKLFRSEPMEFVGGLMKVIDELFDKTEMILSSIIKRVQRIKLTELSKEILIQNHTEALYLQARYSKYRKRLPDCVSYLCLAHNILMNYIHTSKEPRTFSIYQSILLLLSHVLIEDTNYQTAIKYLKYCLKFCFQEIFIRLDIERGISIEELPIQDKKSFNKIMRNIIICLFHLGICYENMGSLIKAIEAYKQTRFFSDKFYQGFNPIFGEIVRQTEKRAFQYYDMHLAFLRQKEIEKKKREAEEEVKQLLLIKNYELTKISSGVVNYIDKYNELARNIDGFRFDEAKTLTAKNKEEQYRNWRTTGRNKDTNMIWAANKENSTVLLTSLRVYNDLLSEDYRPFIMQSNDLNINYLNKKTNERLEKYNLKLKNKEMNEMNAINTHNISTPKTNTIITIEPNSIKEDITLPNQSQQDKPKTVKNIKYNTMLNSSESYDTLFSKKHTNANYYSNPPTSTNTISNQVTDKRISLSLNHKTQSNQNYQQELTLFNKRNKVNTESMPTIPTMLTIKKYQNKQAKSSQQDKTHKPKIKPNPDSIITKYNPRNSYIFNKKYHKKVSYLENMSSKEIKFQKNILRVLKTDSSKKYHHKIKGGMELDQIKVVHDADSVFLRIKHKVNDKIKQGKNAFETETHRQREKAYQEEMKIKYKMEAKTILNLDIKYYNQMKQYFQLQNLKMKKEFDAKNNDPEVFTQTINKISKTNSDILSSLSRDIDDCDKKSMYYNKR